MDGVSGGGGGGGRERIVHGCWVLGEDVVSGGWSGFVSWLVTKNEKINKIQRFQEKKMEEKRRSQQDVSKEKRNKETWKGKRRCIGKLKEKKNNQQKNSESNELGKRRGLLFWSWSEKCSVFVSWRGQERYPRRT